MMKPELDIPPPPAPVETPAQNPMAGATTAVSGAGDLRYIAIPKFSSEIYDPPDEDELVRDDGPGRVRQLPASFAAQSSESNLGERKLYRRRTM